MLLCIYIKCLYQVSKGTSLVLGLEEFFEQALFSLSRLFAILLILIKFLPSLWFSEWKSNICSIFSHRSPYSHLSFPISFSLCLILIHTRACIPSPTHPPTHTHSLHLLFFWFSLVSSLLLTDKNSSPYF